MANITVFVCVAGADLIVSDKVQEKEKGKGEGKGRIEMSSARYMTLSVGLAGAILFSTIGYRFIAPIIIPSLGWFVPFSQMRGWLYLLPLVALVGAITTLRKRRKGINDVIINVYFPFLILITLRIGNHSLPLMFVVIIVTISYLVMSLKRLRGRSKGLNFVKRARRHYFYLRERIFLFLGFLLFPIILWMVYEEGFNRNQGIIVHQIRSSSIEAGANYPELVLPTPAQWKELSIENRLEVMRHLADILAVELGIPPVEAVNAYYEIKRESRIGFYSPNTSSIYLCIIYLSESSLINAVHLLSHELYHHYQSILLTSLYYLRNSRSGFDYSQLYFFDSLLRKEEANWNYGVDLRCFYLYRSNYLEITANEYAERTVERLSKQFGWF